jgi:uncharacterized membrane protein
MLGRKKNVTETVSAAAETVSAAADSVVDYADPLLRDEKLRGQIVAAVEAALAARNRARAQTRFANLAARLAADRALRADLAEMAAQLAAARKRVRRSRRHTMRNVLIVVAGGAGAVAAVRLLSKKSLPTMPTTERTIEEQIELDVPVSTAYNQWTQFEEFPLFMESVDEVRQLDDTLLRWAATVAGRRAEWDAKIVEQEPDRRITWESVDGRQTRGTVTFEDLGGGRSRIRLRMTYRPYGLDETIGSAAGLDQRSVRADLERFRGLIETRGVESGSWRGTIKDGGKKPATARP